MWVHREKGVRPHFHQYPDPETEGWTLDDFPGEGSLWKCHCGRVWEIKWNSGLSNKVVVDMGSFYGMEWALKPFNQVLESHG